MARIVGVCRQRIRQPLRRPVRRRPAVGAPSDLAPLNPFVFTLPGATHYFSALGQAAALGALFMRRDSVFALAPARGG